MSTGDTPRAIALLERIVLAFSGNIFAHAVCLGDADNDGGNELVVGNVNGTLSVFKGGRPPDAHVTGLALQPVQPWRSCGDLGTIACVVVGDALNAGANQLLAVTAEGVCHVFSLDSTPSPRPSSSWPPLNAQLSRENGDLSLHDMDGELAGYDSARTTRTPSLSTQITLSEAAQAGERLPTGVGSAHPPSTPAPPSMQPASSCSIAVNAHALLVMDVDGDGRNELVLGRTDRVLHVYRIEVPGQIGSLAVARGKDGRPCLAVSQPGGSVLTVDSAGVLRCIADGGAETDEPSADASTEVVGGLASEPDGIPDVVALCSLDGSLSMHKAEARLWSRQFDRQFFAVGSLDMRRAYLSATHASSAQPIPRNPTVAAACAWDGFTCLADAAGNVATYQFEDEVCAFAAGLYAPDRHLPATVAKDPDGTPLLTNNVPCLVYVTFSDSIVVCYGVSEALGGHLRVPSTVDLVSGELLDAATELDPTAERPASGGLLAPIFASLGPQGRALSKAEKVRALVAELPHMEAWKRAAQSRMHQE